MFFQKVVILKKKVIIRKQEVKSIRALKMENRKLRSTVELQRKVILENNSAYVELVKENIELKKKLIEQEEQDE